KPPLANPLAELKTVSQAFSFRPVFAFGSKEIAATSVLHGWGWPRPWCAPTRPVDCRLETTMGQQFRGADIVVRSLKRLGCERVFTLSGNHIMSLFDAALDAGLDLVHVRHEAAAVHMADAHGRLTGQPGVAMVTGGPGHANAVGALFT